MSSRVHVTSDLAFQRVQVIWAGISALVLSVGIARFAYTPLLPVMQAEAGLTDLGGGWLATFNYIGYISGAIWAAWAKELHTKFVLYRVWLVLACVTTVWMGLTENWLVWSLLRLIAGFTSTAGLLLASGLVLNWLMKHQFRAELGLHFSGIGLGIMLTGIATGLMLDHLSWDQQWLVFGGLSLLLFIPAWFWMPNPADIQVALPVSQSRHSASSGGSASPEGEIPSPTQTTLNASGSSASSVSQETTAQATRSRWLWLLIASYFCAGFGYVISATFIVTILETLPDLTGLGGWAWVVVGLAAAPSSFLWDLVARKVGDIGALILCYLLQILSYILPLVTDQSGLNLLGAILYGSTFIGIVSLTLSLIGRRFPHDPPRYMARLTISYGVAQVVAPALAGFLATQMGNYSGSLMLATAIMLLGTLLLLLVQRADQGASR